MGNDLAWRIEDACFKAWPALREEQAGGWVLRFADNLTRRANSINPLCEDAETRTKFIEQCEAKYRAANQAVIFRIPSMMPKAIQEQLAARKYTREGDSLSMHAPINDVFMAADSRVEIAPRPHDEWLAAMSRMQGHDESTRSIYKKMVNSVSAAAAFAMLCLDGQPVSVAYGTVHDGLFVFESVITDPPHRGKGYGKGMLGSLIDWAKSKGAEGICLQVQADNANARKLYHNLGLRELFAYHYCRAPVLH